MTRVQTSQANLESAEQFRERFSHLEAVVRRLVGANERVEFSTVLGDFRQHLPTFGAQIDVIEDLSRLRNLIAHGNRRIGKVIPTAETTQELNDAIKAVEGLTENLSRFFKKVKEFVPEDRLEAVLTEMDKNQFSQVAALLASSIS